MKIKNQELKEMLDIAMLDKNSIDTVLNICENEILWKLNENLTYKLQGEHNIPINNYSLNSMKLAKIVKTLPNGTSDIDIKDEKLIISDNDGDIKAELSEGYKITTPKFTNTLLKLKTKEFIEVLKDTKDFTSKDKTREVFTGVYLDYKHSNNILKIVALDNYKLYVKTIKLANEERLEDDFGLIMRNLSVERIKKIKSSEFIEIKKGVNNNNQEQYYITFEKGVIEDGFILNQKYFSYESAINTNYVYEVQYENNEIKSFIKYLEKCKKFSSQALFIESEIQNHKHALTCNVEGTEITKDMDAKIKERFGVAYNSEYMLSAFNIFKENENVNIGMTSSQHGIVLWSEDKLILVIPVNLAKMKNRTNIQNNY